MYCRRCGATLHQGVVICPECGARQRRGISSVRCARCGHRVSLGLTVCPHCGRDVRPAGPRWGLWLVGFAVVAVAALWGLGELPVDRINTEVASLQTRASRIVKFLGPVASPTLERRATPQAIAALSHTPTVTPTESVPTEVVTPEVEVVQVEATAAITGTATPEPTIQLNSPALTATPSPTLEPTATPSPTATLEPTATPTAAATSTPTQPPTPTGRVTHTVKSGDTLSGIATKYGVTLQALVSANNLSASSMLRIGQQLVIPVAGSAPAPTPAPTATAITTAASTTYKVKPGDTLSGIAAQFGITWQELAAANGLTAQSRLNVGQELKIPGKNGAAQVAPTAPPARTATPRPAATTVALLSAPALVNPSDQASYGGGRTEIYLMWQQREAIPAGAGYRVSIQWTEGGAPMEYLVPVTTATSIRMPAWLFEKADQPTRKYTWSVRVVQPTTDGQGGEKDILLSPSSESRVFYWY
jgi:LysM repeat protein